MLSLVNQPTPTPLEETTVPRLGPLLLQPGQVANGDPRLSHFKENSPPLTDVQPFILKKFPFFTTTP